MSWTLLKLELGAYFIGVSAVLLGLHTTKPWDPHSAMRNQVYFKRIIAEAHPWLDFAFRMS